MALHRGIQSAIFYYVSCAPCAEARYRKKRREEAQRDRADREILEAQMPNSYRQPSPSSTNPHWGAEIALGPTMGPRGRKKAPNTATSGADSQRGLRSGGSSTGPQSSTASNLASSVDLPRRGNGEPGGSTSRFQHYQREDEELWGSETALRSSANGWESSSGLSKPPRAKTRDGSSYQSYRHPPVNDMHPAVVTNVRSKEEVAWMLQPPPDPEHMRGKVRLSGNRSDGGSSRPSAPSSVAMSRQASTRVGETRLTEGQSSLMDLSRASSSRTADGQRHDRNSLALSTDERDFADSPSKREKRRPSPLLLASESEDSAVTVVRNPSLAPPEPMQARKRASRPQLSTIMSDSLIATDDRQGFYTPLEEKTEDENAFPPVTNHSSTSLDYARPTKVSNIINKDPSLKTLQDRPPKSPFFNTKVFATSPVVLESKLRLPQQDGDEENRLSATTPGGGPELFDSWYTPDFDLDQWVHEHTKREVRHRWSMDL